LHEFLSFLIEEIIESHEHDTIFNFLLGCGQYTLFAYSWPGKRPGSEVWNGLHYIIRQPPFTTAKLLDVDYSIDFAAHTTAADRVAVIATKPLTEEPGWKEFERGELLMFDKGLAYKTPKCCESVELAGRGLYSRSFGQDKCQVSPSLQSDRRSSCSPTHLDLASEFPSNPSISRTTSLTDSKNYSTQRTSTAKPLTVEAVLAAGAAAVESTLELCLR
jgi:hypothetical protein